MCRATNNRCEFRTVYIDCQWKFCNITICCLNEFPKGEIKMNKDVLQGQSIIRYEEGQLIQTTDSYVIYIYSSL
jgi:hypothetical protein